ncbi:MAG: hypothetical protein U1D30_03590 [Planctomycetota bacterium]
MASFDLTAATFRIRWCTVFFAACLMAMRGRAEEPRRLTNDGRLKLTPSFIDDGDAILYTVRDAPNHLRLERYRIAEGVSEPFLPGEPTHQFDGCLSKDGRYLCYSRTQGSSQLQLTIHDRAKNTTATFNPPGERSAVRRPSFLPAGDRVVFCMSGPGGQQIASTNLDAKDLKLLTQSVGINTSPSVSPDGKRIAFSSSRGGNLDIFVMDLDGSNVRPLTKSPNMDIHPAWSPDGKRLAFTSIRDGNYEVYLMDADGENLKNLTEHSERDDFPSWHPRGNQVVTISERSGQSELYLFTVDEIAGR